MAALLHSSFGMQRGERQPEVEMSITTILVIIVVLAVLGGGWGYTRRGRL